MYDVCTSCCRSYFLEIIRTLQKYITTVYLHRSLSVPRYSMKHYALILEALLLLSLLLCIVATTVLDGDGAPKTNSLNDVTA